jgi:hypothetical protein
VSIYRRAAKIDTSQREMVDQLRAAGVGVWPIRKPCDLLLRFWCNRHHDYCWQTLEVKTGYGKKNPKARTDPRQKAQREFLATTSTPIATTFEEAIRVINLRHGLEGIYIQNPIRAIA